MAKREKLNNREEDVLASLIADAVTDALVRTSAIADVMMVDCQSVRALFAEAFLNNVEKFVPRRY